MPSNDSLFQSVLRRYASISTVVFGLNRRTHLLEVFDGLLPQLFIACCIDCNSPGHGDGSGSPSKSGRRSTRIGTPRGASRGSANDAIKRPHRTSGSHLVRTNQTGPITGLLGNGNGFPPREPSSVPRSAVRGTGLHLNVDIPRRGDAVQGLLASAGVHRESAVRLRGRSGHHVLGNLPRGAQAGTVPRRLFSPSDGQSWPSRQQSKSVYRQMQQITIQYSECPLPDIHGTTTVVRVR